MSELTPEKRAELRKLVEACPFIERENTCKACDAWLFNCCCPARSQLQKSLRDPELVLSLLDALDAKEAELKRAKESLELTVGEYNRGFFAGQAAEQREAYARTRR